MIKFLWKIIVGGKWCDHEWKIICETHGVYHSHVYHLQCLHCSRIKFEYE